MQLLQDINKIHELLQQTHNRTNELFNISRLHIQNIIDNTAKAVSDVQENPNLTRTDKDRLTIALQNRASYMAEQSTALKEEQLELDVLNQPIKADAEKTTDSEMFNPLLVSKNQKTVKNQAIIG